jgi:uncharacterized protein YgiM (DUF1202 family)
MRRTTLILLFAGLLSVAGARGAETGTALKADEIKAEPFRDAKKIGDIAKGDKVEILAQKSGWLQIKMKGRQGWVRLLSVRRGEAGKTDAAKEAGGIAGLATGRAGTGQVVSTTGVRGLGEEDLKEAKYSEEQVKKAESYRVSAQAAQSFGKAGQLSARQMAFLPEPRRAAASSSGGGRQ